MAERPRPDDERAIGTTRTTPGGRTVRVGGPIIHDPWVQPEISRDSRRKWRAVCTCHERAPRCWVRIADALPWVDEHMATAYTR